jgi:Ca2+-binding EF-hand superfamily protein
LKEKLSDEEIKVIITKVDKDHDGKILKQDLHEFIDGLQQPKN